MLNPSMQKQLANLASRAGQFSLSKYPLYGRRPELSAPEERATFEQNITRLVRSAVAVSAFCWDEATCDMLLTQGQLIRKDGALRWSNDAVMESKACSHYWRGSDGMRPTLVLEYPTWSDMSEGISGLIDPTVIMNLPAIAAKPGIDQAQSVSRQSERIALLIPSKFRLDTFVIFAGKNVLISGLCEVIEKSRFSPAYLKLYGECA